MWLRMQWETIQVSSDVVQDAVEKHASFYLCQWKTIQVSSDVVQDAVEKHASHY